MSAPGPDPRRQSARTIISFLATVLACVTLGVWSFQSAARGTTDGGEGASPGTPTPEPLPEEELVVSVGQVNKNHHYIGGEVARVLNGYSRKTGVKLLIQPSLGSGANLRAVITGETPLGFVAGQLLYPGPGAASTTDGRLRGYVRVISRLSISSMTLLASERSGVQDVRDLMGRKIGVLSSSSTDQLALMDLARAAGVGVWVSPADEAAGAAPSLTARAAAPLPDDIRLIAGSLGRLEGMLKSGEIDGMFMTVTHPSPLVERLLVTCPVHLVPIVLDIPRIQHQSPLYEEATIPARYYPSLDRGLDVHTFGAPTLLVGARSLDEDQVYRLTAALFDHAEELAASPLFSGLSAVSLAAEIAPEDLHPGAQRLFRERGFAPPTCARRSPADNGPLSFGHAVGAGSGGRWLKALSSLRATDADRPLLGEAEGEAAPSIINELAAGDRDVGLMPLAAIAAGNLPRDARQGRYPTTHVRTVALLPGDVAQLVVPRRGGATDLMGLSGRTIGYDSVEAEAIFHRIQVLIAAAGKPPPIGRMLTRAELLRSYSQSRIGAVLVWGPAPNDAVVSAASKRPSVLLPLPLASDDNVLPLVELLLPAATYPRLMADDVATVAEPLALLSSDLTAASRVEPLVRALIAGPSGAAPASWPPHEPTYLRAKSPFPRHLGARAIDPDGAAAEEEGDITSPPITFVAAGTGRPSFDAAAALAEVLSSRCRADLSGEKPCAIGGRGSVVPALDDASALASVRIGQSRFGIFRADVIHNEVDSKEGELADEGEPLRAVATLYLSTLTVIASGSETLAGAPVAKKLTVGGPAGQKEAPRAIRDLHDLGGRRISIRHDPGQTPRSNAITLFVEETFFGGLWRNAIRTDEPPPTVAAQMMTEGSVDAIVCMAAHPSTWIDALLKRNDSVHLLPVTGLDAQLTQVPYLIRAIIDGSVYHDEGARRTLIPSVGIPVVLVTRASTPDGLIEVVLSTLLGEVEYLRRSFPILGQLTIGSMQQTGGVRLHPAAARFYDRNRLSDGECSEATPTPTTREPSPAKTNPATTPNVGESTTSP